MVKFPASAGTAQWAFRMLMDSIARLAREVGIGIFVLVSILGTCGHAQPSHRPRYEAIGQLLWSAGVRPTAQALDVIAVLEGARLKGLLPSDYAAAARRAEANALMSSPANATDVAAFDDSLSGSVLRLLEHLHSGRVNPRAVGFDIPASHGEVDLGGLMIEVSRSADVTAAVARAEPPYAGYQALRKVLERYLVLAADSQLRPPERVRGTIRPGDPYVDASSLRRLLAAFGDLPPNTPVIHDITGTELYAGALVDAAVAFQTRHGLEPDSLIGPATMAQLRVPIAQRVRQIELTLERWRWLPDRPPPRYIVVNVPAFRLAMFEEDSLAQKAILTMKVIVGIAHRHHTPVFTGEMREVVFRPYWDVPPRIARVELLPLIRRRPSYLVSEGFEIVRGGDDNAVVYPPTAKNLDRVAAGSLRLRQRPGPSNALGLVKFVFPNRYNVYMHGTPAQRLFADVRRDFSHGCIRLESPTRLAEQVLRDQPGWSPSSIEAAIAGSRTTRVRLSSPVTVYVLYGTAVAGASEVVAPSFFDDIYGHDAALVRALKLERIPIK
jgi:murein L,D-transpeptidase YcbB/YkuD